MASTRTKCPLREQCEDNTDKWPAITYVNVCMYLILCPSPYTKDDMLNYKSLDSYKNFQEGWVREVLVTEINGKQIVIAKVRLCALYNSILAMIYVICTFSKHHDCIHNTG